MAAKITVHTVKCTGTHCNFSNATTYIVETLPSCYFMLLDYMCEVSKLLTVQNPRKISLKKKKLKKRLNTEFPMLGEN